MKKFINLDELATKPVVIEHSKDYFESAKAVGEYLKSLPLSKEQNDKLVCLMVKHTNTAERSGFNFGLKLSCDILEAVKAEKEGKTL